MKRSEMVCSRCIYCDRDAEDDAFCNQTAELMFTQDPIEDPDHSWCAEGQWPELDKTRGVVLAHWGEWDTWEEFTHNWPKHTDDELEIGDEDDGEC